MPLNLSSAKFIGPALPEPFVKYDLEKILNQNTLLPKTTGEEGRKLQESWTNYRRKLIELGSNSGPIRVRNHIIDPLIESLGYSTSEDGSRVPTREGDEDGGFLLKTDNGNSKLRVWTVETGRDLEAPVKRGYAYRFSAVRIAQRVLLTKQERLGLLTDGLELRLLISDSARHDSQVVIPIGIEWKRSLEIPDTFRFLLTIASPKGLDFLPELIDKARLKQSTITKELRVQARQAIGSFLQELLDEPQNRDILNKYEDKSELAKILWREGLIIVYRLLFILKGEASDDPARSFNFTGSSIWRNTYSPTVSLSKFVRPSIDDGAETGNLLETGLKTIFKMFEQGIKSTELNIAPLGGALFGENSTPLLSQLKWSERGCAKLLDKLLWTLSGNRSQSRARERIHYGALDIEDLGRVYEALLELEPGIATERMCRLRRSKLEVVVPYAQGEKYKKDVDLQMTSSPLMGEDSGEGENSENITNVGVTFMTPDENDDEPDTQTPSLRVRHSGRGNPDVVIASSDKSERGNLSSKILWIEQINPSQFYLRVGLGRKSTGSYYTPHSFVRFLVQETLGPKIDECSPKDNPYPNKILQIKVLDPAMGSGHFLVEACRFMGEKLYESCRLCDEKSFEYEQKLEKETDIEKKKELRKLSDGWRDRIKEIPDPENEILKYLPSSAPEGIESGLSQSKALALCKRLVAVHCLYGVDKNPLAVELAKLSLWLESQSEGYPLTFLDHRLVVGDSITGPFFEHLLKTPGSQEPLDDLFNQNLKEKLVQCLRNALEEVQELEKSVGINLTDITNKQKSKERLENLLLPFKILASAWTGSVLLGKEECDDTAYLDLAKTISETTIDCHSVLDTESTPHVIPAETLSGNPVSNRHCEHQRSNLNSLSQLISPKLLKAISKGETALPYDLTFPEVFFELTETGFSKKGFDVVLGNPPWDKVIPKSKEFFASYNVEILNSRTKRESQVIENQLRSISSIEKDYDKYLQYFLQQDRIREIMYKYQIVTIDEGKTGGHPDLYKIFQERFYQLLQNSGLLGIVVPSAFHANEGATGVRKLYLEKMALKCCYSFENKKKLFEIDSRFKFALIVAEKNPEGTREFPCGFYLHDEEWLGKQNDKLIYDIDFVVKTGGEYLSLIELRGAYDLEVAVKIYATNNSFKNYCKKYHITFYQEINMASDSRMFTPIEEVNKSMKENYNYESQERLIKAGYVILIEGKTYYQFIDVWDTKPNYIIAINKLRDQRHLLFNTKYYRVSYRAVAGSTNERTIIFTVLLPGMVCGHSAIVESEIKRPSINILYLASITNSFPFDWIARQMIGSNVSQYILERLPMSDDKKTESFHIHQCLRLVSNHMGYLPLWQEQLGDNWREPNKRPFTWPVLATDEERWEVRSAIDAVVADAYGLSRDQYEHILRSFDRASGPNPYTGICLAKYDELKQIGLAAFTQKYDPYWDIPLNESLPNPVIDSPIPEENKDTQPDLWDNSMKKSKVKKNH